MSDDEAIDDLILRVLLDSPHGREWIEQHRRKAAIGERLFSLRAKGLDFEVTAQLREVGDLNLIDAVAALSPEQIEAVNSAHREARQA